MAAPTLAQLRAGLAVNLGAIPDVQVSAYMLAAPTPPAIHVLPEEITYDAAMRRGLDTWQMTVQAFVGVVSDVGAQKRLDLMLAPTGANSVKAAVEADRTLGGKCDDLRVARATGYQVYSLAGQQGAVLGCEWTVEIIATGR